MTLDSDFWMDLGMVGYYVIGFPIAWCHMRRENVRQEDIPNQGRARVKSVALLLVVLAALWPVLLLAFGAAWLSNRLDKPSKRQ